MFELTPGQKETIAAKEAGFTDAEISEAQAEEREAARASGFSQKEIDEHYGVKDPDMDPVRNFIKGNLDKLAAERAEQKASTSVVPQAENVAKDFWDAIKVGYQNSAIGLKMEGKMPDTVLPEHADTAMRIGTLLGGITDLPLIGVGAGVGAVVGASAGTTVGAAVGTLAAPGAGTIGGGGIGGILGGLAGVGAGGNALPAAMREILVQQYTKGEVHTFSDFWERSSAVFLETFKQGSIGGAASLTGGFAGQAVAKAGGLLSKTAPIVASGAEIATMATLGKAIEGEVPDAQDFLDAAIVVGAIHGSAAVLGKVPSYSKHTAEKLMDIYVKTGIHPSNVASEAMNNPKLKGELLSSSSGTPTSLDPDMAKAGIEIKTQSHPALSEDFGAGKVVARSPERVGPAPETLYPTPDGTKVFHGTKKEFDTFDYSKSGGMVHFAPNEGTASQYAAGAGGNRGANKLTKSWLVDHDSGVVYELRDIVKEGNQIVDGTFTPVGGLKEGHSLVTKETLEPLTPEQANTYKAIGYEDFVAEHVDGHTGELGGSFDLLPKSARVVEQDISGKKILDTTRAEGLQVFAALDPAKAGNASYLIREAKRAIEDNNSGQFSSNFWSATKYAKTKPLEGIINQLRDLGYDGVHFNDDMHKTVTLFESKSKDAVESAGSLDSVSVKNDTATEITPHEQKILDRVGTKEKRSTPYSWSEFYKNRVDKFDPIYKALQSLGDDPRKLETLKNPYALSRLSVDYKSKAKHFFERGTLDYNTMEVTGKSLSQVMDQVGRDVQSFDAYLVSKRAVELEARGIKHGFDIEAAKEVIKKSDFKFKHIAKEVVEFQNGALKYLKDSGYLTDDAIATIKEANQDYVSFKRLFEDNTAVGGKSQSNPIKAIKGSDKKIARPMESIVENTMFLIRLAEQNRAKAAMVERARAYPDSDLIRRVGEVKSTEAAELNKEVAAMADDLKSSAVDKAAIELKPKIALGKSEFTVHENGKVVKYETHPALAEALTKAFDNDPLPSGIAFRLAHFMASSLRLGVAVTPDFIAKNVVRDATTAGVFSKAKTIPFVDAIFAMKSLFTKDDHYWNWVKSGGANGAFLDIDKNYIQNDIYALSKKTGIIDTTWNVVSSPITFLKMAGELAEQSTRLAEFKNASGGKTDIGSLFEGGMAAREVTVDFLRMGAKMHALNAITAFSNVSIQGLDKTARAFKEDPVGMAARSAVLITTPSVLLWYANKDDKRYLNAPRWEKDLFWIVPTDKWEQVSEDEASTMPDYLVRKTGSKWELNKGTVYKIPKPHELGILFGSLPERVLDMYYRDNPDAMKGFSESLARLAPNLIPNIGVMGIEMATGQNMFTGAPIVPSYLKDFSPAYPEYQYTDYTSETAIQLGKILGYVPNNLGKAIGVKDAKLASPVVIDHLIKSWTGNLGKYAVDLADKALSKAGLYPEPAKPEDTLSDIPVVKAFVLRHPSPGAPSIKDFYENYEMAKSAMFSLKTLAASGYEDGAIRVADESLANGAFAKLDGIKNSLGKLAEFARLVNRNPEFTPREQRQLIDSTYYFMITLTEAGNEVTTEVIRQAEELKKEKSQATTKKASFGQ